MRKKERWANTERIAAKRRREEGDFIFKVARLPKELFLMVSGKLMRIYLKKVLQGDGKMVLQLFVCG